MKQPLLEIIPLRPAACSEHPVLLDTLVRVTPPEPEEKLGRPALNLGLVLDRSGSMAGANKMDFARQAAVYAVEQLLATDRVSVTAFDDAVETVVPNTPAEDKGRIVELIRAVCPRNTTALHGGWKEGAWQVGRHLLAGGLNRVLLLSDGLANVGQTNPDAIAADVGRLAREGVSTTAMGVGDDYNEDLLEAMARSGDGNYYYIESPAQLPDIFQSELKGLMALFGNTVSLGVETVGGAAVVDVLNDFDRIPATGRLKLPNLIAGMPIPVVVRLNVPPAEGVREVCRFRLAWNAPERPGRQTLTASLSLPSVRAAAWEALAVNVEVQERTVLLLVARLKKAAVASLRRGDRGAAERHLKEARELLSTLPDSPEVRREAEALTVIETHWRSGAMGKFFKHAHYQAHQRSSGRYREI